MDTIPWIIISLLILLILIGICALIVALKTKKKRPIDYQAWFTIGIVWIVIGVPLKNYALSAIGLIFSIVAMAHKKDWKKNHQANRWDKLSESERKLRGWIMLILGILILIGLTTFFIVLK